MSGPSFFPWPSNWEPVHTGYRVVADRSTAKLARITSVSEAVAHANATTFDVAPPTEPYGEGHLRAHGVVPVQGSPSPVREAWGEAFRARRDEWVRANLQGRALFTREHQVGGWDSGYPPTYTGIFWWDDPAHFLGGYRVRVSGWHRVDATPEVRKRDEDRNELVRESSVYDRMERAAEAAAAALDVRSGDLAIVVRGNKVPHGTSGVVTGVFDGMGGPRARLSPLDSVGRAVVRGGGADTYTAAGNLAKLMDREFVREAALPRPGERYPRVDYNAPVSEAARRLWAFAAPAWPWALRDAAKCSPVMDPLLPTRVAWTCRACASGASCPLRQQRARDLVLQYAALLALDPMAVGVASAFRDDPPRLDADTAHPLPALLDALQGVSQDVTQSGQEFASVGGALAFLNDKAPEAVRDATRTAFRAAILGALGYTFEPPKKKRATPARAKRSKS